MLNMNIYLDSVSYFVLSFLIRQKQIHATIGQSINYMDYLLIEVYGAVGHEVHIQVSSICSPLNMHAPDEIRNNMFLPPIKKALMGA